MHIHILAQRVSRFTARRLTDAGGEVTSKLVLVTYASRLGSTAGVADAIGKALAESGFQVEVRPMTLVTDLSPYHAVIAGSAIRSGQWLPEALQFVQVHRIELAQKPFAAFLVCLTMSISDAQARARVPQWLESVRETVKPVREGFFAGTLDITKMPSSGERLVFRMNVLTGVWTPGDHRDWNAIHAWAASLIPVLEQ
ncbi:MAG: hypothetical protein GC204_13855 [Chloroflexi bacterium]|nr:hypothetical protein [Chloroflexota bacterium]